MEEEIASVLLLLKGGGGGGGGGGEEQFTEQAQPELEASLQQQEQEHGSAEAITIVETPVVVVDAASWLAKECKSYSNKPYSNRANVASYGECVSCETFKLQKAWLEADKAIADENARKHAARLEEHQALLKMSQSHIGLLSKELFELNRRLKEGTTSKIGRASCRERV